MKTIKNTMIKTITFVAMLLVVYSCSGQQDSKTAQNKVKAPTVDIHAAVLSDNKDALQQHIAAGTNINEKDPFGGSSPLITASLFGKDEMVKILVEAGADLNFQNNDGSTPLHVASFFCRPQIVEFLLAKGADKTIRNKYGATALESVSAPFTDVKGAYDMLGPMLAPMGLKLDYAYLEKTRPEIAVLLK